MDGGVIQNDVAALSIGTLPNARDSPRPFRLLWSGTSLQLCHCLHRCIEREHIIRLFTHNSSGGFCKGEVVLVDSGMLPATLCVGGLASKSRRTLKKTSGLLMINQRVLSFALQVL